MWANAQRDGRPAEYRWRPLENTVTTIKWTFSQVNLGQPVLPRVTLLHLFQNRTSED